MQHVERNLFNGERSPGGTFKIMYTKSATGGARVFENMAWSEKIEVLAYFKVSGAGAPVETRAVLASYEEHVKSRNELEAMVCSVCSNILQYSVQRRYQGFIDPINVIRPPG